MASKFTTQKYNSDVQNVNSSILIYLIIQTLRPKKIRGRTLDPKKYYKGVQFKPKKYVGPLRHVYYE